MTGQQTKIVVIGTSAGALDALSAVLPPLPADLPVAIAVVVHVPPGRDSMLADLLGDKCAMNVKEAEDKEPLSPGTIYFAPPDYHLLVEDNGLLSLSSDEHVLFSRPSIDVLFESAADAYGSATLGVILTGANTDGAHGVRAIADTNGRVLVQDPAQALAVQMPEAAIKACPEAHVMGLKQISEFIREAVVQC